MTPEPTDGLTVEFQPPTGPRRRVRYEPRSDGTYERVKEHHNGCRWVPEGREPVTDVVIDEGGVVLP